MHDDVVENRGSDQERAGPAVAAEGSEPNGRTARVSAFVCGEPVPVEVALAASYTSRPGRARWGAPWSTTWFKISGQVPSQWKGMRVEATIDLGFSDRGPGFQAEGFVFTPDGTPVKAVQPMNNWVPVGGRCTGAWSCFVEAVAMP